MGIAEQKTTEDSEAYLDELAPGTVLLQGQYRIEKFLNAGGFGITYLASDSLERKVVIKECFPSSFCNRSRAIVQPRSRAHTAELRSVVQLFVQEARSLAKLNHPNIVGVHQVFEDNQTAYMVLDFVEGRDLLDTLEDPAHGLTPAQIKGVLQDVLSAVGFIHDQDILHRDISPDNILLDSDLRPVLIDFGAAREEATKKSRVLSAMRVVKDGYSPQEFYVQGSEQTPSSDLYALGATFYHLIVGEIPANSQARLAAIASGDADPYVPLVGRVKGYDTRFLAAIDKALGVLPKDRMQSAEEWLDAMEGNRRKSRVLTQPVPKSSAAAAAQEPERRSALVPLLGSVAVVALLAVGGLAVTGNLPGIGTEAAVDVAVPAVQEPAAEDAAAIAPQRDEAPAPETQITEEALPQTRGITIADAPVETGSDLVVSAADAVVDAPAAQETPPEVSTRPPSRDEAFLSLGELTEDVGPTTLADGPAPAEVGSLPVAESLPALNEPVVRTPAPALDLPAVDIIAMAPDLFAPQPVVEEAPDALGLTAITPEQPEVVLPGAVSQRPVARPFERAAESGARDTLANVAQAAADIAAPPPAPVLEPVALLTATMRFDLPFSGVANTNVIRQAADVAPVWVRSGSTVLAVNGVQVNDIADIDRILAEQVTAAEMDQKPVNFMVKPADDTIASLHPWILPITHVTTLADGTAFETVLRGDTWTTTVTATSDGAGELQVGDVVVASVETSQTITDPASLRDVLSDALSGDATQFNFAVTRGGSMWVVPMTYNEAS
ncbi:MAG: protein kinase [Pseudomonadota bacterium]